MVADRRRVRVRRASLVVVVAAGMLGAWAAPGATAAENAVAVIVVPVFDPATYAERGAVGLLVPGSGTTVSRAGALASLLRGSVVSEYGTLEGSPTLRLATEPAATTIYVALPPWGSHPNTTRYPVAIVGSGYRGLLVSTSTRIDGLVSLADIAPTAAAIETGAKPQIGTAAVSSASATLERLDRRLSRADDVQHGATIVLVAWLAALAAAAFLTRSAALARAALLAPLVALGLTLAFSALGVDEPATVIAVLAVACGAVAIALGRSAALLVPTVFSFLAVFLLILVVSPEINALAAIGPHPETGGRFYGVTNRVETVLLAPALAVASFAGRRAAVATGLILLAAVGWSRAGADGGGVFVIIAALAVLAVGHARARVTPARLIGGLVLVIAAGLAFVGIDVLVGGSSHISGALDGGFGGLLDDLERRLEISWSRTTAATLTAFLCVLSLCGLAFLGALGRRFPVIVAMAVAIGVSLLVNDTPLDVLGFGVLGMLALTAWEFARAPVDDVARAVLPLRRRPRF